MNTDPEEQPRTDGVRVATYSTWRSFAAGNQWPRRAVSDRETRLVINYPRALLRKVASYVFPGLLKYEIDRPVTGAPPDEAIATAERALAEVQIALSLDALDLELEIERSTIGDAAIKITWDDRLKRPRVVPVDPANLSVLWSVDDPDNPYQVAHTYTLPGHALMAYTVAPLDPERVYTVHEVWSVTHWKLTIDGITDPNIDNEQANPFGWIPYLVLPNDPRPRQFWGYSDLIDLVDVTQELNRELSTLSNIMQLSGAPITVLENVDGSEGIHAKPGAKWELPADSKAYLLDLLSGQGVKLHIDYISELRTSLHDLSETPRTAFGDTGRALSGAALEVEIQPLVQRVRRKRAGWERFHRERNYRLLDLMDRFGPQPISGLRITRTIWPDVLPSDEDSSVRNQVSLVQANIRSRQSAAAVLGSTDPTSELALIIDELTKIGGANAAEKREVDGNRTNHL